MTWPILTVLVGIIVFFWGLIAAVLVVTVRAVWLVRTMMANLEIKIARLERDVANPKAADARDA